MLEVEAALANACGSLDLIPREAANVISAACKSPILDAASIAHQAADHATPVVPLVKALRDQVGPELAEYVHFGATSQDILDTAAMLCCHRAASAVLSDAEAAEQAAARLADAHRNTVMAGRTLLQQALPTTFGLRAASWLVGLHSARSRLNEVRERELPVQMGGPVGTRDPAVAAAVAAELGLAEPILPWHTIRTSIGQLAGALGVLVGVLAKVARDVTLLAQSEVEEIREGGAPGRGSSSSMPHKRNPAASVSLLACARRVPGLVATLLASMEQEHERAAGAWQAEWGTLTDLVVLSGSAASWGRDLVEHLEVDPDRMRANVVETKALDTDALIDRALSITGHEWEQKEHP
jgi:3-carboxy-cis,cis-muconate cycloisomerase